MSQPFQTSQMQFYMTRPSPCPYLPERQERKLFAHLDPLSGPGLHDAMLRSGFRRSQNVVYRPACEGCDACRSVRICADRFTPSRSQKRTQKRNADLITDERAAEATVEQFQLLKAYLGARHPGGGMTGMSFGDYAAMMDGIWARTRVFEFRLPGEDGENGEPGKLVAAALSDWMSDGLSMVYSYFDPTLQNRSLGAHMILDHIARARAAGLPYVYLGYWVPGSPKMDYKSKFRPLEVLRAGGWRELEE